MNTTIPNHKLHKNDYNRTVITGEKLTTLLNMKTHHIVGYETHTCGEPPYDQNRLEFELKQRFIEEAEEQGIIGLHANDIKVTTKGPINVAAEQNEGIRFNMLEATFQPEVGTTLQDAIDMYKELIPDEVEDQVILTWNCWFRTYTIFVK